MTWANHSKFLMSNSNTSISIAGFKSSVLVMRHGPLSFCACHRGEEYREEAHLNYTKWKNKQSGRSTSMNCSSSSYRPWLSARSRKGCSHASRLLVQAPSGLEQEGTWRWSPSTPAIVPLWSSTAGELHSSLLDFFLLAMQLLDAS
jgi:hypothetical protein